MLELGTSKKVSTPFSALVGQQRLKRGLLALAVEDDLAGVLLRGEKGTGKSTAVRAMTALLPTQQVVADCPYGCPPPGIADATGTRQCASCRSREDPPVETRPTPLVTLPLGATRDRVVGTLSVADALGGEASFDPGLLARANRGVLYVDEVNLLEDHLVDVLLDAAAAGVNRVERDGVSVAHPAEFALVGTMNPEEGDLRAQLRDRFDLCVEVTGAADVDERVAILEHAIGDGTREGESGETDADHETEALAARVSEARDQTPTIPREFKTDIAELCLDAGVEGHRADIAIARAARGFAALAGRPKVIATDVAEAAEYALAHRMRSRPFEDEVDPSELIDERFDEADGGDEAEADDGERSGDEAPEDGTEAGEQGAGTDGTDGTEDTKEQIGDGSGDTGDAGNTDGTDDHPRGDDTKRQNNATETAKSDDADASDNAQAESDVRERNANGGGDDDDRDGVEAGDDGDHNGEPRQRAEADPDEEADTTPIVPGSARAGIGDATAPTLDPPDSERGGTDGATGRTAAAPSPSGRGATVRTEPTDGSGSVDAAGTVRAAAQSGRTVPEASDLRQSVRTTDARTLTVFVTDASASMASAMRATKGVVLELLREAYTAREEVALISVGGTEATVVLPPTDSVSLAARHLKDLPTADRTPLPSGLETATAVLKRADPDSALVVIVSDGRANVADGSPTAATRAAAKRLGAQNATVLLVSAGDSRAGLLDVVADATDADRIPLSVLSTEAVTTRQ